MFSFFEKLLFPFPVSEPSALPRGFYKFVWICTEGIRLKIAVMAVLTIIVTALDALLIVAIGRIIDWLGAQEPSLLWDERGGALILIVAMLLVSIFVVSLQSLLKHQALTINLPMRLRWNFHRLMLRQSIDFYQDKFSGAVTAKVMQTSLAMREVIFVLADVAVAMCVYVVTIIVLIGMLDVRLIWPFIVWMMLYVALLFYVVPRLNKIGVEQSNANTLLSGRMTDAYTNIATVKLFSHTQAEAKFSQGAMQELLRTGHAEMRLVSSFEIANHFLKIGLMISTIFTALWLWSLGSIGVGAVAACAALALRLQGMSQWLMWEMTSLFESIGAVRDGMELLSTKPTVRDRPGAVELVVSRGEINFERVSFSYGGDGRCVIKDLSFTVKPGEKIGLVGRSGAGKSTLLNLLLRLYDLKGGRITIDGQDIADATQESLRRQIGMVAQDTALLHRSIADNISYSQPDSTLAQVKAAARRAEADTFIHGLRDDKNQCNYSAHVGDRGVKLSGGERQRIAISRVILKDAPILLLDEATSALDSELEALIQRSLYTLMEGKTVIAIAHRLSTIAAMDRLLILDEGGLIEQGSHHELLAQGGLYSKLWALQSDGFIGGLK